MSKYLKILECKSPPSLKSRGVEKGVLSNYTEIDEAVEM